MPIKRVEFPDGSVRRIEVPEGATNEQILAFAKHTYQNGADARTGALDEPWKPKQRTVEDLRAEGRGFDPTEGMSAAELNLAGIGESIDTGVRGLKQVGTSMADYFVRSNPALFDGAEETSGGLRARQAKLQDEQSEAERVNAPLNDTAAGMTGNIVGTLGQFLGPALALRGTVAGAALLPRTVTGNAALGAAVSGMQPTTSEADRAGNIAMGAGLGAAGQKIPQLAGAAVRKAGDLIPAFSQRAQTRAAAEVLDKFAADPAAIRMGAHRPQVLVPGSVPTLAEASGDVGLAGLQRTLANTPEFGNALAQRQQGNNLARVKAIEGAFGGADDAAADSIRGSRDAAARRALRPIAKTPMGRGQKELTHDDFAAYAQQQQRAYIAARRAEFQSIAAGDLPPGQAVLPPSQRMGQDEAVQELARLDQMEAAIPTQFAPTSEGIQLGFPSWKAAQATAAPVVRGDLDKVTAAVNRLGEKHPASVAVQTAMDAVKERLPLIRTVQDAHDVRQYIGELIAGRVEGKAGAKLAQRQLMVVRDLLDREMRAAYPEWGKFLREYKAASREADQVSVGAELLGTGRAVRSATNDPSLTPAAFGRAAGNLDRTVQRATGFNRASASRTLTPEQQRVVESVRQDLERYSRASTDGKAVGSNSIQNIIGGNSLQSAVGPVGAAVVEPISGIALMGLNQMRRTYGAKVAGLVEEAMLDPARAAEILSAVPAGQRSEVVRRAARFIPRISGAAGAVSPALTE